MSTKEKLLLLGGAIGAVILGHCCFKECPDDEQQVPPNAAGGVTQDPHVINQPKSSIPVQGGIKDLPVIVENPSVYPEGPPTVDQVQYDPGIPISEAPYEQGPPVVVIDPAPVEAFWTGNNMGFNMNNWDAFPTTMNMPTIIA